MTRASVGKVSEAIARGDTRRACGRAVNERKVIQRRAVYRGVSFQIVSKMLETPVGEPASTARFFDERFGLGEVFDGVEAEQFEEALGGAVEDGAAGLFGAAGDLDQVLFHQAADRLAAGHAADRFDVGAEDRLLVSDDGQSLYGRLGELGVNFLLVELLEQVAEFRDRENLESAGHLLDAEAAVTGGVDLV